MKLKAKAQQLEVQLSAVFIAYRHPDTPKWAKVVAALTICYALSPIDLVPDFIPVLGYLDDLIILPLLIAWSIRLIPARIMEESRAQAKSLWQDGKPKSVKYAIPIVLFWLLITALIICGLARRLSQQ